MSDILDTSQITDWRSIVVLIVFVLTNVIVLFPFHIPIYFPRIVGEGARNALSKLRLLPPRQGRTQNTTLLRFNLPLNLVTTPLIADLFLLAITAIGRKEVYDGTVGTNHIFPIDIMAFFITLAYIAVSIDSSGLIRFLAYKVLQKGGKSGRKLYLYLYAFFFGLATLIGNDPIVLSGTPFLAYMTRASRNIKDPRAWIFTQFAVSNVASAILVSSNPTNLVLAGAFNIKFIEYTANIVVPVLITAALLCFFLVYVVFRSRALIPVSIERHELSEEQLAKSPVNPNIPSTAKDDRDMEDDDVQGDVDAALLEEILNPYLDKTSACVGAVVMTATLVVILAINAASQNSGSYPAYWVTCPAAFVMLCWDLAFGWVHRHDTRNIARQNRKTDETSLDALERPLEISSFVDSQWLGRTQSTELQSNSKATGPVLRSFSIDPERNSPERGLSTQSTRVDVLFSEHSLPNTMKAESTQNKAKDTSASQVIVKDQQRPRDRPDNLVSSSETIVARDNNSRKKDVSQASDRLCKNAESQKTRNLQRYITLYSVVKDIWAWSRETFPTATTVLSLLPFALVPFGLTMFILVQALVSKGWVAVFAYGWNHWIRATGTIGAIGGMGFLSVVLCNCAGTNIGTTILLCRVVQAWVAIHQRSNTAISSRTFWAAVYSMALGLNYGAFSTVFSASLAGLLWKDILSRKQIQVRARDFVKVNAPIIAFAMAIGCCALIGEVYIVRRNTPYIPH